MTAPEQKIIEIGLTKLRRYIRKLREDSSAANRPSDGSETAEQTFRRLVVLTTNLANHITGRRQLPTPSDPVEIFMVLGQAGLLPAELAGRLRDVAVLRSRLAHGFQEIPPDEVRVWVPDRLNDFSAFAECAAEILLG